MTSM